MKQNKYHYVYRLDDPITNEFYIGSRSCNCSIDDDTYMGSYYTWKPDDKSRLVKTILKSNFKNRETAIEEERTIIKENITNPLNRNYHIPSDGFHNNGRIMSEDTKGKIREARKHQIITDATKEKIRLYWTGRKHTLTTIKKMSDIKQGNSNPFFGKTHTPEWKQHMSLIQKQIGNKPPDRTGTTATNETKCKMSKTWLDKLNSPDGDAIRKNISDKNSKVILQYDKDGAFIKEWKSLSHASTELNISVSNISSCSNGKLKTAGGYCWKKK